jgi:hypothetical protein
MFVGNYANIISNKIVISLSESSKNSNDILRAIIYYYKVIVEVVKKIA